MKKIVQALNNRIVNLNGSKISHDDILLIAEKLKMPEAISLLQILSDYPITGCTFFLDDEEDQEVELQWMNSSQIISEALDFYPGKILIKLGYMPIGICTFGTGDYYYLKIDENSEEDPPLVRAIHDGICEGKELTENSIEVITDKLSTFIESAEIY